MDPSHPTADLVTRLQAGDESAASQLYDRFAEQLLRLSEREIDARIKNVYGPEEAVQSALKSFLVRVARDEYQFQHSGAIWQMLKKIVINKIRKKVEHYTAQKRDVTREVELDSNVLETSAVNHEHAVEIADAVEHVLTRLDEREKTIFCLLQEDYSSPEIAAKMNCSRWAIQRVRTRISELLAAALGISPPSPNG